jgi:hypothetical protein
MRESTMVALLKSTEIKKKSEEEEVKEEKKVTGCELINQTWKLFWTSRMLTFVPL